MDFHAHLSTLEIIGYLGGTFDEAKNTVIVQRAFPAEAIQHLVTETSVEMAPESEISIREKASQLGMEIVGWY